VTSQQRTDPLQLWTDQTWTALLRGQWLLIETDNDCVDYYCGLLGQWPQCDSQLCIAPLPHYIPIATHCYIILVYWTLHLFCWLLLLLIWLLRWWHSRLPYLVIGDWWNPMDNVDTNGEAGQWTIINGSKVDENDVTTPAPNLTNDIVTNERPSNGPKTMPASSQLMTVTNDSRVTMTEPDGRTAMSWRTWRLTEPDNPRPQPCWQWPSIGPHLLLLVIIIVDTSDWLFDYYWQYYSGDCVIIDWTIIGIIIETHYGQILWKKAQYWNDRQPDSPL